MFLTQFDELQNPFRRNIVLKNVSRRDHIATTFSKDSDLFDDIIFQLFIRTIRKQILLIYGTPEGKLSAEPLFHIVWQMPQNIRLNWVKYPEAHFAVSTKSSATDPSQ